MKTLLKHRRLTIAATTLALLAATLTLNSHTLGALIMGSTTNGNTTGLVGHWTMDGNHINGTTLVDQSGQGNNGTLTNGPTPVLGKVGQAMEFDNTDDYISVANSSELQLSSSLTLSAWIYPKSLSDYGNIVGKPNSSTHSSPYWDYALLQTAGTDLRFQCFVDGVSVTSPANTLQLNTWNHVLCNWDKNTDGKIRLYHNGNEVASSSSGYTADIADGGQDLLMGIARDFSSDTFNGYIDDVRVYNRALTENEIGRLHERELVKHASSFSKKLHDGLVGYWPLDDGSGTTATDLSVNGNNGTLTNMDSATDWISGKVGTGALDFDGTDDFVSIPADPSLSVHNSFTLTGWIKPTTNTSWRIIYDSGSGNEWAVGLWNSTGELYFSKVYGTNYMSGANITNDGLWHHIAVKKDGYGSQNLHFYVDGTHVSSTTLDWASIPSGTPSIGGDNNGDNFVGNIDDIRLYNRALSNEEIKQIYNNNDGKSPISHWTFDGPDISGTIAFDIGSGGNNGTLTNGPVPAKGRLGQGLSFDGTNQCIFIPNTGASSDAAYTYSVWFKANTTHFAFLVSESNTGSNTPQAGIVFNNGVARAIWRSDNASLKTIDGTTNIDDGEWHHLVAVGDGSNMRLYVDGIQDGSDLSIDGTMTLNTTSIGCLNRPSIGNYANGIIDDARIYDRALTAAEINDLYNENRGTKTSVTLIDPLEEGLMGHWSLDDGTGSTTAADLTPNGNNGTLTNMDSATDWVSGQVGAGALDFDDSNDYVTMGNVLDFDNTDPFSISVWFKRNAISNGRNTLVSKRLTSGTYRGYYLTLESDNTFRMMLTSNGTGDSIGIDSGTVTDTTDWHHGVVTYDGSSSAAGMKLYLDSVENSTITHDSLVGTTITTADFNLGSRNNGSDLFGGVLDDVRIYSRELSADEVKQLYDLRVTDNSGSGPIGHWTFDGPDISGTTAYDMGSGGNNGTLTNGPTPVFGKVGQALDFDGTDDYALITEDFTQSTFTVTAWFKQDSQTNDRTIVENATSATSRWWLGVDTGNLFIETDNSGSTAHYSTPVSTNTWYFVAAGVDASGDHFLYLNGSLLGSGQTSTPRWSDLTTPDLYIGTGDGFNDYFDGTIDDVRVYNRELTAAEISELYLQGR